MSESRVLVIIVTYEKKEYVSNLLASLRDLSYRNYDVVVIDNASTDGTAEHLSEHFPAVKIIRNPENTGGSGGFNTGLRYAFSQDGYDYYWLLDNDVVVSPDALGSLARVLDEHRDIAVAGSQMCQLDNPEVTNEIGAYVDFGRGALVLNRNLTRRRNNAAGLYDVDYVAAASLLVRADVARAAGLWEDFFIHFDDVDWCLRIRKMGHRVVAVADSVIWHLSAAEKPITWARYYDVRNMLYLLDKHAAKGDVARFGKRKILQALYFEMKGLTPIAEIVLDAVDDFMRGTKGKKVFHLPAAVDEASLRETHPGQQVLIYQNEHFDLRKFPFAGIPEGSLSGVMCAPHMHDALFYWSRNGRIPLVRYSKAAKLRLLLAGLAGYRRYTRTYTHINGLSFVPAILSQELAVRTDGTYWLLPRDPSTVWRSLRRVVKRGVKQYLRFMR